MTVHCFTDASYSKEADIASCGYLLIARKTEIKHQIVIVEGVKKSSLAEAYSIYEGLREAFLVKDVLKIRVCTDCQSVIDILNNPRFRNKRTGVLKEIIEVIDIIKEHGIEVVFSKVPAHSDHIINNKVDRSCLKHLREHLKKQ